jgi:hypothetical protein
MVLTSAAASGDVKGTPRGQATSASGMHTAAMIWWASTSSRSADRRRPIARCRTPWCRDTR